VLLKRMSIADGLTIANGLCGLAAIIVALGGTQVLGTHGHALSQARFLTCAALIVTGGIIDLFDGVVARRRGTSGLGTQLDAMCDILTFAVAPAAVLIASSVDQPTAYRAMTIVVAALFVTAAMLRLARHATDTAGHATSFCGLPVPPASLATLAVLHIQPGPLFTLFTVILLACLMISELPYPHPNLPGLVALTLYLTITFVALATNLISHRVVLALALAIILAPMVVSALKRHSYLATVNPTNTPQDTGITLITVANTSAPAFPPELSKR
jgi:CDP-diacylglycerol--serine O-phosphatidyltransferase